MFSRGLEATVAHLRAHGLRVVILGGVPEIGWDVPSLLASRRRLGIPLPPLPTLEEVKGRHAAADRILEQIVERQGAELIPLAPLLCRQTCPSLDGKPAHYADDHQLSIYHGPAVPARKSVVPGKTGSASVSSGV